MPRKTRIEIEGGLYHLITRGNDRKDIFHSHEDHAKFLQLLLMQKERLPFYLYAYCLMTNHIHILIERRTEDIGRIMHRVLTAYTQYYNRKYKKVGHLLQGRYKSVICQSESYLTTLVRYIHLNPVKAKMVATAAEYPFSSHRTYLGIDPAGPVDVDSVLRHFGSKKAVARKYFSAFVDGPDDVVGLETMLEHEVGILGNEEFVDATIHRLGEHIPKGTPKARNIDFDAEALMAAVEAVFDVDRSEICGRGKASRIVAAKETLIVAGRQGGASLADIARLIGLATSTVSRRYENAITISLKNDGFRKRLNEVASIYDSNRIAILQQ